jgi:hypothetical protein
MSPWCGAQLIKCRNNIAFLPLHDFKKYLHTFFDNTSVHGTTLSNTMVTSSLTTTTPVTPVMDNQQTRRYEGVVALTPGYKEIHTLLTDTHESTASS